MNLKCSQKSSFEPILNILTFLPGIFPDIPSEIHREILPENSPIPPEKSQQGFLRRCLQGFLQDLIQSYIKEFSLKIIPDILQGFLQKFHARISPSSPCEDFFKDSSRDATINSSRDGIIRIRI